MPVNQFITVNVYEVAPVRLNINHIVTYAKETGSPATRITIVDGSYLMVSDTAEQLDVLIQNVFGGQ